jgi:hypothetical protein
MNSIEKWIWVYNLDNDEVESLLMSNSIKDKETIKEIRELKEILED